MYWDSIGLAAVGVPGLVASGMYLSAPWIVPSNMKDTFVTVGVDCGGAGTRGKIA